MTITEYAPSNATGVAKLNVPLADSVVRSAPLFSIATWEPVASPVSVPEMVKVLEPEPPLLLLVLPLPPVLPLLLPELLLPLVLPLLLPVLPLPPVLPLLLPVLPLPPVLPLLLPPVLPLPLVLPLLLLLLSVPPPLSALPLLPPQAASPRVTVSTRRHEPSRFPNKSRIGRSLLSGRPAIAGPNPTDAAMRHLASGRARVTIPDRSASLADKSVT